MREFEKQLREHRLKKRYYLTVVLGKALLTFFPDNNYIREEVAISYYWLQLSVGGSKVAAPPKAVLDKILNKIYTLCHCLAFTNDIIETRPATTGGVDQELLKRSLFNHSLFIKELETILSTQPKNPALTETEKTLDLYGYFYNIQSKISKNVQPAMKSLVAGPKAPPLPLITFSITTCKRLSLFKITMNSFLNNFQDLHLISRWICVDDNSKKEDKEEMEKMYPFFEFYWKTPEQQGHYRSMQIIAETVKTPYLLHMEDDRMLLNSRQYLKDMIDILDSDRSIGQVVFNHNYKESVTDDIRGGAEKQTRNCYPPVLYYEHEHCTTESQLKKFQDDHGVNGNTCHYYPHFSLNPSLINTKVFRDVEFKDELSFEYHFARRYTEKGYKTAFLPGYHFKHIGRLTSDTTSMECNAYDLLNEKQYWDVPKYKSFYINLDRRQDRNELMKSHLKFLPTGITRKSAYDGSRLVKTPRLYSLCRKCDYAMRPGVIGCALSHLKLYLELLSDSDVDGYLIFEDDVTPDEMFLPKLARTFVILQSRREQPDIIFFTTTFRTNNQFPENGVIRKFNRGEIDKYSIGGTGCYYISKHAAKTVFDYIETNTLDVAIDALLFNISNLVKVYFVQPPIISQTDVLNQTDVQHDHWIKSYLLENPCDLDKYVVYNSSGDIDLFDFIITEGTERPSGVEVKD